MPENCCLLILEVMLTYFACDGEASQPNMTANQANVSLMRIEFALLERQVTG